MFRNSSDSYFLYSDLPPPLFFLGICINKNSGNRQIFEILRATKNSNLKPPTRPGTVEKKPRGFFTFHGLHPGCLIEILMIVYERMPHITG